MHVETRNVGSAFHALVRLISGGLETCPGYDGSSAYWRETPLERTDSRNGPVVRFAEPVTVTYTAPTERVLLNPVREVNPFSLCYELLWTLAGRNDVDPIAYYTPRMREFSDDGVTWHGAYGHRWRTHFGRDQLVDAVARLCTNQTDRRVALAMWDARVDGTGGGKDYPCNTHAYFAVRSGRLDLTVCNRSNDMLWGLLGANYVVFSGLLEYVAQWTGLPVGRYHHVTNDLHVYETRSDWKPTEFAAADKGQYLGFHPSNPDDWAAQYREWTTVPLVRDVGTFNDELPRFVEHFSGKLPADELGHEWAEPFLAEVAAPLLIAWACHKERDYHSALQVVAECVADDWRLAAENWLRRRAVKHERRA